MKRTLFALSWSLIFAAEAELRVGSPFADNMVIQRDRPVMIWGEANPGETVTVAFAGQSVVTKADAKGAWRLKLAPMPASKVGRDLVVATSDTITFRNVVVGEVWLASGQSNMELPLWSEMARFRDGKGAMVAQITHLPNVRLGTMPISWKESDEPRAYTRNKFRWMLAEPENLRGRRVWSAIAFWYARELTLALDVPVGIIGMYQGGTGIDKWTPAARGEKKGGLFNEWVAPVAPYTVRGMLWYQGCADAGNPKYCEKMHDLYRGWTNAFENAELPIYFVQIPDHGAGIQLCQAQFAEEEPHAGMVVVNDVANPADEHPARKEIVAQRLALHALKRDYGFPNVVADSPKAVAAVREGGGVRVKFANAKFLYVYNDDMTMPRGFEIAGADGVFHEATIRDMATNTNKAGRVTAAYAGGATQKPELLIAADAVAEPHRIRYLFARAVPGSVFSEVNLPLGAFDLPVKPAERQIQNQGNHEAK